MGFITCILFAFVVPIMGQTMYSKMISFNNGNYNVSWIFNASTDALQFLVKVRATGWVGFGFALNAPNNMTDYDVAVGGVLNNGTSYLQVKDSTRYSIREIEISVSILRTTYLL